MCCRYYVELSPELRPIIEAAEQSPLREKMVAALGKPLVTSGEAAPTDIVPVIAPSKGGNTTVYPMVWGYRLPGIDRPVINARVETANTRPAFKEGWARHRCVIPASYYFEWEHIPQPNGKVRTGSKYAIQPAGMNVCYLAGLYRIEEERGISFPVFTILTREPGEALSAIHDRMPLILPFSLVDEWVSPSGKPDEVVKHAVTDVVFEKAAVQFTSER